MDPAGGHAPHGLLPPQGPDGAPAGFPPGFAMPGIMPGLQMPASAIPGMNDPAVLSQLAGIPAGLIRDMPTMAAAAQNLSMQALLNHQQHQQQMAALAGLQFPMLGAAGVPGGAPLPSPPPATKGGRGGGRGRPKGGRSGGRGAAAAAVAAAAPPPPEMPLVKEDPGGKVIWAKSGHLPWWPAKTLDPSRDRSFPADADPPRPTAIPIRFFGTHEFAWLGSKRAMSEWEDGLTLHGGDSGSDGALAVAVAEAKTYLAERTLPDAFYIHPEPENAKRPAKGGRKRGAPYRNNAARDEGGVAAGGMTLGITPTGHFVQMVAPPSAVTNNAALGRPRQRGPAEPSPAERAALVHERKKARLRDMGLMPLENSPFVCGAVASNPALLERAAAWEAAAPAAMAAAREEAAGPETTAPPRATIAPPPPPEPEAPNAALAAAVAAQHAQQAQQAAAVAAAMGMGMGMGMGGIPVMGFGGGLMPVITPEQMQAMQGAMMGLPGGAPFG